MQGMVHVRVRVNVGEEINCKEERGEGRNKRDKRGKEEEEERKQRGEERKKRVEAFHVPQLVCQPLYE